MRGQPCLMLIICYAFAGVNLFTLLMNLITAMPIMINAVAAFNMSSILIIIPITFLLYKILFNSAFKIDGQAYARADAIYILIIYIYTRTSCDCIGADKKERLPAEALAI